MVVHLHGHRSVFLVPWLDAPERIDAVLASEDIGAREAPSTARVVPLGGGRQEFGEFIPCGGRPPLGGLRGKPSRARIDGVAVIERIGSSGARPSVLAWGRWRRKTRTACARVSRLRLMWMSLSIFVRSKR